MKRSPINPISKRKAAADRVYKKNRTLVYDRDVHCQAVDRIDGHHCNGPLHVHHILPRSRGGTHDLSNLILLCDAAHSHAHSHPVEAEMFGLIRFTEADQ